MFFTYADKQGSIFSDAWQVRQVAFDTLRRYLYYSVPLKDARVLSPIDTRLMAPMGAMTGTTTLASQQTQATLSNTTQATSLSTLTGRRSSSRISAQHAPTLRHSTADMTAMMTPITPAAHHVATATTAATTTAATPRSPVTATEAVAQTPAAPPSSPSLAHSSHSGGALSAAAAAAAATGGGTARASTLPPHSPASPRPDTLVASSTTASTTVAAGASGQQEQRQQWDTYSPSEIVWKKKIKVDAMVLVTKEHSFALDDVHLCEQDFFQVELYGDTRPLALGECPSPGPLLCPSAGLHGMPERCNVHNDDYLHDRFFLRELYESLRDQFINLRIERERITLAASRPAAATTGAVGGSGGGSSAGVGASLHSSNSGGGAGGSSQQQQQQQQQQREEEWRQPRLRTLQSPRKKGAPLQMGSRVKIVLRLRSEYEFRRFTYVVQTVLGYDKLCSRPYRGLPPYDPRNGLVFAQIPMCVWQTFRSIDKTVFYTFLRCDVVGRGSDGDLVIYLRGGYLCITHDAVLVLRDSGQVPRWVRLVDVHTFYYNSTCHRPYVVFLSDGLAPDLVLLPQHPVYGPEAIRHFSAAAETLRVRHVMHEISFASLDIRRVVHIAEAAEPSVRAFVMRYERERGTRLKFEPVVDAREHDEDGNNNNHNSDNSHHRHHSSSSSRVAGAAGGDVGGDGGDNAPLHDAEDNGRARASATARRGNAYPSAVVPWAMSYALLGARDAQHPPAQQQQQQSSRQRQHHHHHSSNDAAVAGSGSRTLSQRANGPLPQEQLAQVWRDVQHIYASRDPLLVSQAAIPLYENNTNDARLTREQLDALERLMSHERASEEDIVGMSYEEIQQVELQHAVAATRRHRRERERRRQQQQQQRGEGDGGGVGSSDNVEGSATAQHPRHTSRHRSRAVSLQQQQQGEENAPAARGGDGGAGEAESSASAHDRDTAVAARTRTTAASDQPTSIHVYHHHGNNDDNDEEHHHRSGRHGSHHRHAHSYRQQRPRHHHQQQEGPQGQTPPSFASLASPDETALHLPPPPPPPRRGSRNDDEGNRDSHTRRLPQHDRNSTTITATAAMAADGNVASPMATRDAEEASDVGNYSLRNSSRSSSRSNNHTDASGEHDDDDRERSSVSTSTASSSLLSSSSRAPSDYVVPGSRYVTREELLTQPDHLQRVLPLPVIEEHHVVVRTSPSPAASPMSSSARQQSQEQQQQSVSQSLHGVQAADAHVSSTSQSAPAQRPPPPPSRQQQQHGRAERTRSCSCSGDSHDEHPQQQQSQQRQCLRHARTAASSSLRSLGSPRARPNTSSLSSSSSLCRRGSEGGAAVHAVHKTM